VAIAHVVRERAGEATLGRESEAARAEQRLVAAAASGEPRARERLVEAFMPRIAGLAGRFSGSGVEAADLRQQGCLALLEALERYRPGRGAPFWAYASAWVHGAMYRLAYDQRQALHLPAAALAQLGQLRRTASELGGAQRLASVAEAAGVELEQAHCLLAAGGRPRSLDEPLGPEADAARLGDLLSDPCAEEAYDEVDRRVSRPAHPAPAVLLAALPNREREVLVRRFGLGVPSETLAQVGRRLGVTRERTRQIEQRALGKLRAAPADAWCVWPHSSRRGRADRPAWPGRPPDAGRQGGGAAWISRAGSEACRWSELVREALDDHMERRRRLFEEHRTLHQRAAALHEEAARRHERQAVAFGDRGDDARSEREQARARAAAVRAERERSLA
jgi:RNA polymerase sigma factor (sigma-70 family)